MYVGDIILDPRFLY